MIDYALLNYIMLVVSVLLVLHPAEQSILKLAFFNLLVLKSALTNASGIAPGSGLFRFPFYCTNYL